MADELYEEVATKPLTQEERDDAAPRVETQAEPETAGTPEDQAPVVEDPDTQIVLNPDFKVGDETPEEVAVGVPGLDPEADYVGVDEESGVVRVVVTSDAVTVPRSVALSLADSPAVKIEEETD